MGTIYKKQYSKPIPTDAKVISRNGKRLAQWKSRSGKLVTAELTSNGDGIRLESKVWYAKYRDGDGIVQDVSTGCRDKQAASTVLKDLEAMAERVKAKIVTSAEAKISAKHADTPLSLHIGDYAEHLKQRRVHPDRIKTTKKRLTESADACCFRFMRDMNADRLQTWLNTQVDGERGMSAAVFNGYVQVWISFGHWLTGKRINGKRSTMKGEQRCLSNPFDGMGKLDERADPKRKARSLTADELDRLLKAATARPLKDARTVRRGEKKGQQAIELTAERTATLERLGRERALIYKTAILTGLRLNELRTLAVGDLSFGDVPFIRLNAANEKNRQGSTLPLRSDLAAELREWVADRERTATVFCVPAGLLRILDRDLAAAGIPKRDADGCVVHVHALRHSFGTHLSMAGVAPRIAQAAMRHSNISLTMNTYTDSRLLDTAAAVESMGLLRKLAPNLAPDPVQNGQNQSIPDQIEDTAESAHDTKKPHISKGNTGFISIGPAGFEPTTSTTPRYERGDVHPIKTRVKRDLAESLHQILHKPASLDVNSLSYLLHAVLGDDGFLMLLASMNEQAEAAMKGGEG